MDQNMCHERRAICSLLSPYAINAATSIGLARCQLTVNLAVGRVGRSAECAVKHANPLRAMQGRLQASHAPMLITQMHGTMKDRRRRCGFGQS